MRTIGKMLVFLLGAILIGTLLLVIVYMLPTDGMRENVKAAMKSLSKEGVRNSWAAFSYTRPPADLSTEKNIKVSDVGRSAKPYTISDGYTDAIMLSKAIYAAKSPVSNAMMNPSYSVPGKTSAPNDPVARLGEILSHDVDGNNAEKMSVSNYPRYWHGYLVCMKPLLMFAGVSGIRIINLVLQLLMFTLIAVKISEEVGAAYSLAFAASVLVIDPISAAVCFQYSHVYYVILATMAVMLCLNGRLQENGGYCVLFMFSGILTAYMDLLTYPFASLGMPMVLYLILKDNVKLGKKILDMIALGLSWLLGYAGMWAGKWLMSWLITGYNAFGDAMGAVSNRVLGEIHGIMLLRLSSTKIFWLAIIILFLVITAVFVLVSLSVRKGRASTAEVLPLCLVSLYPFVWYSVVMNHSVIHYFFTHKLLAVSVFSLSCVLIKCSGYKGSRCHE